MARLHAAQRVRVIVIERAGRGRRLVGKAEFLQAGQEFLEMLAAEVMEHVVARGFLAAPGDQAQHQRGHQRIVECPDRPISGELNRSGHRR